MSFYEKFLSTLHLPSAANFEEQALALFYYQYQNNQVYKQFVDIIGKDPQNVTYHTIPFLPIEFFKTHEIKTQFWQEECIFESSGTTGMTPSLHYVKSLNHYLNNAQVIFEQVYGSVSECTFLALLPSYLERGNSSLVAMVDYFIKLSKSNHSGFFHHDHLRLYDTIKSCLNNHEKVVLIGVTYALLDFAELYSVDLKDGIVIETGGMKGRKKELVREQVHEKLKDCFNTTIQSEYGMTELMSQAYATKEGIYQPPPWLRAITRDVNDPFCIYNSGKRGAINIIDLANIDTCAFIATQDLGIVNEDYSFEILGRFDNSDLRGCSLLTI